MPAKMPLYQPEQLNERGAELGKLARVFVFATERDPDIFVDVTTVYSTKISASLAHRSQFPQGEADLEWIKERDKQPGNVLAYFTPSHSSKLPSGKHHCPIDRVLIELMLL